MMQAPEGSIVVGVDGSQHALAAVDWAYAEARLRNCSVHLVTGVHLDVVDETVVAADRDALVTSAQSVLGDAEARRPADLGQSVTSEVVEQPAAPALVEASKAAHLVAMGTRGYGGFAGMLLGSVSQHVTRHAHCDVAVVRPQPADADHIVAGVDMSDRDGIVLKAAFEEAQRRHVQLKVVHARSTVTSAGPGMGVGPVGYDVDDRRRGDRSQLANVLKSWISDYSDVKVTSEVLPGHPVATLATESARSQLLVVGARGGGGFARLLLGSATHALLHHAACPMLVAR
jgi:nucleotide-binding universal stress UspA family protein